MLVVSHTIGANQGKAQASSSIEVVLADNSSADSRHREPIIGKRRREDDDANISKNKTQKKIETLDSFLQSLGLEKYLDVCHDKKVNLTAPLNMSDRDLYNVLRVRMLDRVKLFDAADDFHLGYLRNNCHCCD